MFTHHIKQLVGIAPFTTSSPSRDIGSQPVHTKVSPRKAVGKKHLRKAILKVVVVPVPFRSLPGNFMLKTPGLPKCTLMGRNWEFQRMRLEHIEIYAHSG
jgi:hypothetical protein